MLELADKDIKTVILTVPYVQEARGKTERVEQKQKT